MQIFCLNTVEIEIPVESMLETSLVLNRMLPLPIFGFL